MDVRHAAWIAVLLAGASAGCENRRPSPSAAPATEARPDDPPPIEPRPVDPPPPARTHEQAEDEAHVDAVLARAAEAAERARPGADHCETAFNGLVAMMDVVDSEMNGEVARPERVAFLEACRALPAPAQRCLIPAYAFDHQADCERILERVTEEQRQALEMAVQTRAE